MAEGIFLAITSCNIYWHTRVEDEARIHLHSGGWFQIRHGNRCGTKVWK